MLFPANLSTAPRKARVLVTGGEYIPGLAAIRALRMAGYEPWAAVEKKGGYAAHSRAARGLVFHPDPAHDGEGFVQSIADAAKRLSVAAVLPGNEKALIVLSENMAALPQAALLGTPPAETVRRVTDKRILHQLANAAGLMTPPTLELRRDELASKGRDLRYPVVAKPLRSETLSKAGVLHRYSAQRIETAKHLQRELESLDVDVWLVQPYLTGTISAVSGFVWEGEIVCAAHQDMHRIYPPPPGCGHTSYAETVAPDFDLEEAVARLLRDFKWSGIFQFEFIKCGAQTYLMDFNPRFYLSLALTVAAGHNLPAIWVDHLLGHRPAIPPYRVGVRYRNEEKDFRVLYHTFAAGDRWSALKGLLPRRRTVHAVFSLRDPFPVMESVAKLRSRFP
jgi:predicted ATP-grasp superfamily ATP-dependent carboligase